jgi:hypothetical protein
MMRLRLRSKAALMLVGGTVLYAACASNRPPASFQQDFRGGSQGARDAWFRLLVTRYGCDTTLVKAPGPGNEGLMMDATTCASARTVMPETVRAWSDTTGVWEEWEYFGSHEGGGFGQTPWWGQSRHCKVTLRGPDERSLRVTDIVC